LHRVAGALLPSGYRNLIVMTSKPQVETTTKTTELAKIFDKTPTSHQFESEFEGKMITIADYFKKKTHTDLTTRNSKWCKFIRSEKFTCRSNFFFDVVANRPCEDSDTFGNLKLKLIDQFKLDRSYFVNKSEPVYF